MQAPQAIYALKTMRKELQKTEGNEYRIEAICFAIDAIEAQKSAEKQAAANKHKSFGKDGRRGNRQTSLFDLVV